MRKLLTLLFVLSTLPCAAQSYDYLTLRQTNGDETSFSSDKLKITFDNGVMTLNNGVQKASVALGEINKMFFASAPTAISNAVNVCHVERVTHDCESGGVSRGDNVAGGGSGDERADRSAVNSHGLRCAAEGDAEKEKERV